MTGQSFDLEDWVIWNGGVDVRKLIAKNEVISKEM